MLKYLSNPSTGKEVSIEFTTGSDAIRKVFWNDDGATLSLEMDNGVIQEIGKQQFYSVKNNSASAIVKGAILSYSGAVGANGVVHVKLADSSESASLVLGVASGDIAVGEHGLCTSFGVLQDINTTGSTVSETWASGDILYLDQTTDGDLTKTKPSSPNIKVSVGTVVEAHATLGVLLVRINQGNLLEDNHDVQLSTSVDGEVLSYNGANGRWENANVGGEDVEIVASSFSGNLSDTDTDVQTALDTIDSMTKGATVTLSTGTIPATAWVDNTGDYDKKLDFDISGIVAADWVDVAIDKDSIDIASDAEICPTVEEYAGGITVFAQYVPASSISISYKIVHT